MLTTTNLTSLEWKNLNYTITKKSIDFRKFQRVDSEITILKNANGVLNSGSLVAILGSSGAGKTTLLAAISQRIRGKISGQILINGQRITRKQMVQQSCFVPQFDMVPDGLTAREHLFFMAELRMNKCLSAVEKSIRINEILWEFGILKLANIEISKMSGGERKKLSLVTELLLDPNIIFCDEPTTGLDSFSALSVVQSLRELTQPFNGNKMMDKDMENSTRTMLDSMQMELLENGYNKLNINKYMNKIVICSIHQPTSSVFKYFSHIILMENGRIAFQGTVDEGKSMFAQFGFICPREYNPAEFFVKIISENTDKFFKENENITNYEQRHVSITELPDNNKRICWPYQVFLLMRRTFIESQRTYTDILYKMLTFLLTALSIGLLYGDTMTNNQKSIQDVSGFIFNLTAQVIFATAYNVIFYYPSQLPILRRETGEKIYDLSAYYVATFLCSIPRSMLECYLFLLIIYPNIKFAQGIWLFFEIGMALTITTIPATAYGYMLSGMTESSRLSTELAPPFDVILVIVAGFYIKLQTLWFLKYISVFFYSNEAISIMIWNNVPELDCNDSINGFCLNNGTEVLASMSYNTDYEMIWFDYIGMISISVIMHSIGYVGVLKMVNRTGYY